MTEPHSPSPSPAQSSDASLRTVSPRQSGWHARDVARATIVVLLVLGAADIVVAAHNLVFVGYLGLLMGLAVSAGATRLQRFGIAQGAGAGLIVAAAVALLIGFGAWTGPTVRTQYRELQERIPEALVKLDRWLGQRQGGLIGILIPPVDSVSMATQQHQQNDTMTVVEVAGQDSLSHVHALKERLVAGLSGGGRRYLFPVIHSTVAAATGVLIVLFMSIYIGADPKLYRRGIIRLIPHRARSRGEEVLDALAVALRRWLTTQLIAMITLGAVTTLFLVILRVRAAIPLGILAGLLEFVPTVGPIVSAVPSILMAFIDSPEKAAAVAVAYYIIHFIENHLLIPLLMKEGVNLPPVLTILTQAGMALTFGVMGLFVAVPMLVLVTILVKMLYVEDVLGDRTSLPLVTEGDRSA